MKKQLDFELAIDEPLFFSRTKNYFTKLGFDLIREDSEMLVFERGSTILNFFTFNPLKWKSRIEILVEGAQVKTFFDINTVGQVVTKKEDQLWVELIQNYHLSIVEGKDFTEDTLDELKSTKLNSFKIVRSALFGALIFGIPSILLAVLTGYDSIAIVGPASGAVGVFMNELNKEKAH